jgi:hypothetical protein
VVLAHGTSLFVIMPTSLRGAIAYHREPGGVAAVWPIGHRSISPRCSGRASRLLPPEAAEGRVRPAPHLLGRPASPAAGAACGGSPGRPRLSLPFTLPTGSWSGSSRRCSGVGGGIVAIPLLIYA